MARCWRGFLSHWKLLILIVTLAILGFAVTANSAITLSVAVQGSSNIALVWPVSNPAFALESSASLAVPNWIPLTNATVGNGFFTVNDRVTNSRRFYRLSKPLDPQTVFYENLIGLQDARLVGRLDAFITAIKQAGLYSNIIDGVLLRTNWQPSPAHMVTFFGKSVTNNNATFAASGVVFDGATSWLKFPCALPVSNTVYCLCQNNSASNTYGNIWTAYANADPLYYTYATGLIQNMLQIQEYDFVQWTNIFALTSLSSRFPQSPGGVSAFIRSPWIISATPLHWH